MKRFVHILLVLSLYGAWTSCSDSVSGNSIIDEPDSRVINNWCGCPDKHRGKTANVNENVYLCTTIEGRVGWTS